MIKFNVRLAFIASVLVATLFGCNSGQSSSTSNSRIPQRFVAVTQIVEHPSLDATREGIKDELAAAGLKAGDSLKWEWESAQGNPSTATQIASKFAGENPDVVVAIATPSAQASVAIVRNIPVIFTAVTDPIGAKLVNNLEKPGGLVTGVTDLSPLDKQLDLIQEITPTVKRLGVIYNAGEANSVSLIELLKTEATKRGLTVIEATANRSSDVATSARSLVGKVEAIYIPTDNTIVSALESVIQVGIDNKIPVYAGDTDSVKRGAMAGLSFNYYQVGRQTGKLVLRVLNGESPGNIPVESVEKLELFINPKSATAMGVKIPDSVLKKADKRIE
ncbi:ABC superfamily ATP binding cassette transporter, binding protein [Planktothrix serta PCC 8927]|uniref:ABC superfamily ATP binding cassette transporter, binding protein n=1 Tax=Planktothrix serta PCC 8927 TaxID=671068 RepID=A0A7Z9BVE6_9CYAN|nr:ABC transporter substrate-binding protein [Planktothrix serta]VXD19237.1 ABC superfamily ATP binding cassette transporter, binding protein [Planktothrix serta PCC 8927]